MLLPSWIGLKSKLAIAVILTSITSNLGAVTWSQEEGVYHYTEHDHEAVILALQELDIVEAKVVDREEHIVALELWGQGLENEIVNREEEIKDLKVTRTLLAGGSLMLAIALVLSLVL